MTGEVVPNLTHMKRRQRDVIRCLLTNTGSYILVVDDYRDMSRECSVYDDQGNEYMDVKDYIVESFVKRKILIDQKTMNMCLELTHTYLYLNPLITLKMI